MSNSIYTIPTPVNEPIKSYAKNSIECQEILKTYNILLASTVEIPLYINGEKVYTNRTKKISPPHLHQHILGTYSLAKEEDVSIAIETCLAAKTQWANTPWQERAAVFLKAAALISGPYRYKINAATMLCQSKNIFQAEIDSACELIDFFNFNAKFMEQIYTNQPISSSGIWNQTEYRPLEGFIYAVTPFNFTAIAGNLCAAPVLMGNVCVWKPSDSQIYSANIIMEVLEQAGLPKGVINLITGDAEKITNQIVSHPEFSGLHFTGSTQVFKKLWQQIGNNIHNYKNYPRIVGETGGKDFVWAYPETSIETLGTALIRGAFEYQGQKCSAASRAYIPKSLWKDLKLFLTSEIKTIKVGGPQDPSNFVNAVIHKASYNKLVDTIEAIKASKNAEIIVGGTYNDSVGYFIDPTVVLTTDSNFITMENELFGPILTIYLYEDQNWKQSLDLIDQTSEYALTGSIFAKDRYIIEYAKNKLENAAGNFYINDKPTGAVVGQQPFGGARSSGTNDKAGSIYNLLRWVSPRTVKETFVPPTSYKYPFLEA